MSGFDLYLRLERMMIEFDEAGDPLADRVRDLMDPIWFRLSPEEVALLDSRGLVEPSRLFPVRLPAPPPAALPTQTISGRTFTSGSGCDPDASAFTERATPSSARNNGLRKMRLSSERGA